MSGWTLALLACNGDLAEDGDADGDGFVAGADCDDADPEIHPDAGDEPGDGTDRNCDGWDGAVAELASAHSVPPPDPNDGLEFGHAMAAGDIDGDGAEEILVGSQDTWNGGDIGGGQVWLFAGSSLDAIQGWAGEEERGDYLGLQVAVGSVLEGPPALILFSREDVYVVPTAPVPESQFAARVVPIPQHRTGIGIFPSLTIGNLVDGGVDDLAYSCTGMPPENAPEVRIHGGPLDGDEFPVDAEVVIDTADLVQGLASVDLDGDGFDELVAGISEVDDVAGRITFFRGPLAVGTLEDADADTTWFGEAAGDWLGQEAIDAGDVDGDGLADAAVAAMGWPGHARRGRVYVGDLGTPDLASAKIVLDGESGDGHDFGRALAAGDYDGDGQGDLAVGAPSLYSAIGRPGRVYLYLGPVAGPVTASEADQVWVGESDGDWAARDLAFADLDGDGADELVVGASHSDDYGPNTGKLYLIAGSPP